MGADKSNSFEAIFRLQEWLNFLSGVNSHISGVEPDGVFGSETENAVRRFQLHYGMTPTGTVDHKTWERIKTEYKSLLGKQKHAKDTEK